jgi:hypothetical protein
MLKASDIARFLIGLALVAAIALLVFLRVTSHAPAPRTPAVEACDLPRWQAAATANAASLTRLAWAPFGRAETGWEVYAPLIAHEVGTGCGPGSGGFAAAFARWQAAHQLAADGILKPADFAAMLVEIELRRPFVQATAKGVCPPPAAESQLALAAPRESYGGKPIQLRADALAAYRRLVAAARAQGLARHGEALMLVSGYRGADEEAERCADGGCGTASRAKCSAHRTGLALDLYLDHLPGQDPTSTDDANRAAMARSPEYRWLVANAGRFGFVNYPFEPWHWEWTGEPL